MAPMSEFEGKVAIVTGAAGGVGGEVVRLLHEAGARVVAEDLNPAVADLATDRIVTVQGDVSQASTADAAVTAALESFGQVDILVNNAIARRRAPSFLDMTDEDWDVVLATGL
ncbi:MAG: hypothetical protein QOG77_575, partial [Solirubrobacteraceae bacterium]|nr:hypothetical protein [Solirubrobacteraceae bacterium]